MAITQAKKGTAAVLDYSASDGTAISTVQVPPQAVDPAVSREKFAEQVAAYRTLAREHQRRGWWLVDADFPTAFVVMAAPQLAPPAVVCGVLLDFTNYDLEAPSVRLANPFTREPYRARELPTILKRKRVNKLALGPGAPVAEQVVHVPLMQAHQPDDVPFLCIPGVREYHSHPAHTGDSWLAHRGRGAGTLYHILNVIHQYGIEPISDYGVGLRVVGFQQQDVPA
jgi:hypothetical protein